MNNGYYAPFQRPMGYYNPSIPTGQDAQYMQQYQQVPQQIQQNASDMVFVLNETEAMAYPVAPNNRVTLWDKNKDTVYIKSNMQGLPSMRILDYTERQAENNSKTARDATETESKFVCIDDFKLLQQKIENLQNELDELKPKTKSKAAKKEMSDEE